MAQPFVWVICRNKGTEGLSAPFGAFMREAEARAALALMDDTFAPSLIIRVPTWTGLVERGRRQLDAEE